MSDLWDELMYEAKVMLRLKDTSDHDADMELFINEGIREICSLDTFVDCTHVYTELNGNTLKLPMGFKSFTGFRFIGIVNADTTNVSPFPFPFNGLGEVLYVDYKWLPDCNVSDADLRQAGIFPYTTFLKINKGYIVFNTNVSTYFTKGELAYKGLAKDADGRPLLKEEEKRGVRAYVCWRMGQIYQERYDKQTVKDWLAEWTAQKGFRKGEAIVENFRNNQWVISNLMRHIKVNTF